MQRKKTILFFYIFLPLLFFYLYNLFPSIYFEDSAEFAACLKIPTLVHSTGYPLFFWIFYFLLKPFSADFSVLILNLSNALFSYLAAVVFCLALYTYLKNTFASVLSTFALFMTFFVFSVSVRIEIYTVFFLFFSINILLFFKYFSSSNKKLYAYLFCFFFLFSFSHHYMSLFLIPPAVAVLIDYIKLSDKKNRIGFVLFILLCCIITFSLYLTLFSFSYIKAPVFNWKPFDNFKGFFSFVTGGNFKSNLSVEKFDFAINLKKLFGVFFIEAPFFIFFFFLFGFIDLFIKNKRLFIVLFSAMAFNIIFVFFYDVFDKHYFYFPVYFYIYIFAAYFLKNILAFSYKNNILIIKIFLIIIFAFSIFYSYIYFEFNINFKNNYLAYDYALLSLKNLEKKSVVLTNWQYYTPMRYFQMVKKIRDDIFLVVEDEYNKYDEIAYECFSHNKNNVYAAIETKELNEKFYLIPKGFLYKLEKKFDFTESFKGLSETSKKFNNYRVKVFYPGKMLYRSAFPVIIKLKSKKYTNFFISLKIFDKDKKIFYYEFETSIKNKNTFIRNLYNSTKDKNLILKVYIKPIK